MTKNSPEYRVPSPESPQPHGLVQTIKNLREGRMDNGRLSTQHPALRTADLVIANARIFVRDRVRWVHQGRNPEFGLDCLGLMIVAAQRAGIQIDDYTAYSGEGDFPLLRELMGKVCFRVRNQDRRLADIAVFAMDNFDAPRKPFTHVAYFADRGAPWSIIHCWANVGLAAENIFDDYFEKRLRETWRLKALE